jgi:GTP cyclohydrolase I
MNREEVVVKVKGGYDIMSLTEAELESLDSLRRIIAAIGDDPKREGLEMTPVRIIESWKELYKGYKEDPQHLITTFDSEEYDEMVTLCNVEFYSMCEHHMLPFFGECHMAYIPNKQVIGVSKMARLLEIYARRLQIQERMTYQIANFLFHDLQSLGAACVIRAQHLCMTMRGVGKQHSIMKTSSMLGAFINAGPREEFLNLCKL